MGDASSAELGSAQWENYEVQYHVWMHTPDLDGESSNFQEANNLVSHIRERELITSGFLLYSEVFIVMGNQLFRFGGTFYKSYPPLAS
jgi:hypothetical protein